MVLQKIAPEPDNDLKQHRHGHVFGSSPADFDGQVRLTKRPLPVSANTRRHENPIEAGYPQAAYWPVGLRAHRDWLLKA